MASKSLIGEAIVGLAVGGAMLSGCLGLLGAVIAFFQGQGEAAGAFLIAASLAFGLLVNAALRD